MANLSLHIPTTPNLISFIRSITTHKPAPRRTVIFCMDYAVTIDGIQVGMDVTDSWTDELSREENIQIDHADFLNWLDSKSYREVNGGQHEIIGGDYVDNTFCKTVGYCNYLKNYITRQDVKNYLIERKIVTHEWDSSAI